MFRKMFTKFTLSIVLMTLLVACYQESNIPQTEIDDQISESTYNVELRSDDCTPENTGLYCSVNMDHYITTVNIPSYPNCDIEVKVYYKICNDPSYSPPRTVISFHDVEILSMVLSGGQGLCQLEADIHNQILPGSPSGPSQQEIIEQNEFFNNLYNEIYDEVGMNFIRHRASEIPDLTLCGQAPVNVIAEFYTESCYQVCYCSNDGDPVWEKLACGNGCCIRTTEYCINNETGRIETTSTTTTQSACTDIYDTQCSLPGCLSTVCLTYCE